ncbi:MAG: RAD55 family ATPase [Candidatus Thorarchaeota archaeon]
MEKQRTSSGIQGLDTLLNGGYVTGRSILIAGGPGSGKSILTWHFLFEGLSKDENVILLSLDQSTDVIIDDMAVLGWNPTKHIEAERLHILSGTLNLIPTETGYDYVIGFDHPLYREQPFSVPRLAELVKKRATETNATRIVIDGLGPLLELAGNRFEVRQMVYSFIRELVSQKATTLLTHELRGLSGAQNDEMPYFITDGVINLDTTFSAGDFIRTLRIIKMRGIGHVMRPVMFKIAKDGITVFPDSKLS